MAAKRNSYSVAFKVQVAFAALKGEQTVGELASQYGVSSKLIHAWKKQLLSKADQVFQRDTKAPAEEHETLQTHLFEEIHRLKIEVDWLRKKTDRLG